MDRPAPPPLDPTAAIVAGWRQLSRTPGEAAIMVAVLVGCIGVMMIPSYAAAVLPLLTIWTVAVQLLIFPAISAGVMRYVLYSLRGESPSAEVVITGFSRWWPVTGSYLLQVVMIYGAFAPFALVIAASGMWAAFSHPDTLGRDEALRLIALMGLALLPILALAMWLSIRFCMIWFVAMEPNVHGPLDVFKRAWGLSRGRFWRLSAFFGLTSLVSMAGFLACGVGLLVAIPIVLYACAHVYDQLTRRAPEQDAVPADLYPTSPIA